MGRGCLERISRDQSGHPQAFGLRAPIVGDVIGPNPTDRAKSGTKESLLVDRQGGPLSIVVAPANINDHLLLEETIESIVVERPEPTEKEPQHLCLDAGYNNALSKHVVKEHGYEGHIRPNDLAKWHTARGSLKFLWFSMLMGLSLWVKTSPFSVGVGAPSIKLINDAPG